MTQHDHDAPVGSVSDLDPDGLFFADSDDYDADGHAEPQRTMVSRAQRRHSEHARRRRRHRRGWISVILLVAIVAVVGVFVTRFVVHRFATQNYSGSGYGSASITIPTGASASDIGTILKNAHVVKSATAFTDAASGNSQSALIQPGTYKLHLHMSGAAALTALLDPASRDTSTQIVVTEGATSLDVTASLVKRFGAAKQAAITGDLHRPVALGVPVTYTAGKTPASVEGFLYPATYTPDPSAGPKIVLQNMVSRFIQQDRDTGFARGAAKVNLTPYQALTVASIAQSEAKFPQDMPKVARTILNRLKAGRPLQFDSTSSYACKLTNTPSAKCIYSQIDSPYNTYQNKGLPPTPIDNPGADAMNAAVHPASGDWLYFVNQDAAGHLFFTSDAKAFEKAANKCKANHWGCG